MFSATGGRRTTLTCHITMEIVTPEDLVRNKLRQNDSIEYIANNDIVADLMQHLIYSILVLLFFLLLFVLFFIIFVRHRF